VGRFGKIWQDLARFGKKIWQECVGRFGKIWQDLARFGKIWQDLARFGKIWQDLARRFGKIWQDCIPPFHFNLVRFYVTKSGHGLPTT